MLTALPALPILLRSSTFWGVPSVRGFNAALYSAALHWRLEGSMRDRDPRTPAVPEGWLVEAYGELASTQSTLAERMQSSPRDRHVIVAEHQSAGRGRRDTRWESPRGGLWFSFSLVTKSPPDPCLNLLVALAACEAIDGLIGASGPELRLKWPNDLVTRGCKWGGILCDVQALASGESLLLFGAGLNLAIARPALPEVAQPVTSIEAEFGMSPFPLAALSRILSGIDRRLTVDREQGRSASIAALSRRMTTCGRRVSWQDAGGSRIEGAAIGLESDGALLVRQRNGQTTALRSGEVRQIVDLP